jgi:hypothetical protein
MLHVLNLNYTFSVFYSGAATLLENSPDKNIKSVINNNNNNNYNDNDNK